MRLPLITARREAALDAAAAAIAVDGNCPVREHTADGHFVGRCEFALYAGHCPRHGRLAGYERPDGSYDDRDFPPHDQRDFSDSPALRRRLGVDKARLARQRR